MNCPECGEPLYYNLEEVLVVTVLRISKITGIEYEGEGGEVLFDYAGNPIEDDQDVDTPVYYQCGYCGEEIDKATMIKVLHAGEPEDVN
jgi:hypothetical protein